jgi:hypothetical protein
MEAPLERRLWRGKAVVFGGELSVVSPELPHSYGFCQLFHGRRVKSFEMYRKEMI